MSDKDIDQTEREFAAFARQKLEDNAADLDEPTRTRLRAARRRALKAARGRRPAWLHPFKPMAWLPAGAVAAVTVLALTWLTMQRPPAPPPTGVNMQVLTAEEDLDFYRNLEFYLWLDARDATA